MKIAVLGSTRGTDLQAIIDEIESGKLFGVEISLVLSNKKNAYILERARKHNLTAIFLDPKGKKRKDYDLEVTKLLEDYNIDLILLIGYMKLMTNEFVDKYRNRVMNIHPSLLPAFAGGMDLNVHEAVLKRGCKITGASLIFIDEGADTGPIISQRIVPVLEDDTLDTLKNKVQTIEQQLLIEAIGLFRDNRIVVEDNRVIINST